VVNNEWGDFEPWTNPCADLDLDLDLDIDTADALRLDKFLVQEYRCSFLSKVLVEVKFILIAFCMLFVVCFLGMVYGPYCYPLPYLCTGTIIYVSSVLLVASDLVAVLLP